MSRDRRPGLLDETLRPARARAGRGGGDAPALTILYHPDLRRVGQRVRLLDLTAAGEQSLSRLEPEFWSPDGLAGGPLADPFVSRRCARLSQAPGGGLRIAAEGGVRVDGDLVQGSVALTTEALERGAVVVLQDRVILLAHRLGPPAAPASGAASRGLLGESEAMARVREEIGRVAELDVPVLLRGPSGTGKELVARAIHEASGRARGPLVTVNMAAITPSTAASELFGHARGAFTGASRAHAGHFGRADSGTLFLDEIGEAAPDLQAMLLRALETGEVQPVGGEDVRRVDVRLVAATDRDLEAAVAAGTFRLPLFHRLATFQIDLPPLTARRDDLARLLVHFLALEAEAAGEAPRLSPADPRDEPWLPPALAERLLRHAWPGNVRELRNAARQLVIAGRGRDALEATSALERLLRAGGSAGREDEGAAATPAARPARTAPGEIDDDALLAALAEHGWGIRATARGLGISKTTLYKLIEASPSVRKAKDLPDAEILAAFREQDGDVTAMSAALRASGAGIKLRLRELGLLG